MRILLEGDKNVDYVVFGDVVLDIYGRDDDDDNDDEEDNKKKVLY